MNTYEEAEAYISEIPRFAGKHTLQDTGKLLMQLTGGIQSRIVHVAGTNGKGSVCAYLSSILQKAGCSVGLFTSPHLETMQERIQLNDHLIPREEFLSCFERVRQVSGGKGDESHPSYFEFLFLMAMVYFAEKKPEYIILETGLGGRLDATNCIEKPEVCVITEIGMDHMQYLGNTFAQIAAEKAGIIKPGVPVVFVNKRKEVTQVLTAHAEKAKSMAIVLDLGDISDVNIHNKTIDFSLHTGYYNYIDLFLDTTALYQTENASLAILACEVLMSRDARITRQAIRDGLKETHWPGRMEEAAPGILLDGAHNEDGIEAFLETVRARKQAGRNLLLFGVVADKHYEGMIALLAQSGLFDMVAVTALASDRSAELEELKKIWGQYQQVNCFFMEAAQDAYRQLLEQKQEGDILYIAGSLYLIGQIRALVRRIGND